MTNLVFDVMTGHVTSARFGRNRQPQHYYSDLLMLRFLSLLSLHC